MNHRDTNGSGFRAGDGRAWAFGLAAVLLIGLLAWGPGIGPVVLAGYLNQTIPTPTPQGKPTSPPNTARPAKPTEGQMSPTAVPTVAPTATRAPDQPAPTPVTEPATAPATEPTTTTAAAESPDTGTATSLTPEGTRDISGSEPAAQTPQPPALAGPTATETIAPAGPTPAQPVPAGSELLTQTPAGGQDVTAEAPAGGTANLSWLWLVAGLVLIGAGVVVLLGRGRSG